MNINEWQELIPQRSVTQTYLPQDISSSIREKILTGELKPGTQLPNEAALAELFGVSRNTLRDALNILQQEGTVIRRHGVGTFLTDQLLLPNRLDINLGVTELVRSLGLTPSVGETNVRTELADPPMDDRLKVKEKIPLVALERVRMANGRPVVYSVDRFPLSFLKQGTRALSLSDFSNLVKKNLSLYKVFEEDLGIKISYGIVTLRPTLPDDQLRERLQLAEVEPLMFLSQTDYDETGRPLVTSEEYHVSDVYTFTVHRQR